MTPEERSEQDAAAKSLIEAVRTLRRDGWQNDVYRMGGSQDAGKATAFVANARISDQTLSALYSDNALAKRIVREVPASCFRRGVKIELERDDEKDAGFEDDELKRRLISLDLFNNFVEAVSMGRLYGGALLVAGLNDGLPASEPLALDKLASVPHLTVVDRRFAIPFEWYDAPGDELLPEYGQPKSYRLFSPGESGRGMYHYATVHASRAVRFGGAPTTLERRIANVGWDDSVFQSLQDILTDDANTWGSVNRLIGEAAQGVLRIKGLIAALASPKGREAMTARADYFDIMRNIARTIFVDSDHNEDYKRDQITFSGLSDLLDKHMLRVCANTEYPATVLYGRSPAGLAATGDNELKQYNVKLKAAQESYIPALTKLVTWVVSAKDFPYQGDVEIEVSFPSLWDLTDTEEAQNRKTEAEADKLRIDGEVYLPEEVALARAKKDRVKIDRLARERVLKAEYADPPSTNPPSTNPPSADAPSTNPPSADAPKP